MSAVLYNLAEDIGETTDVKESYPDKLLGLMHSLEQWETSLNEEEITVGY